MKDEVLNSFVDKLLNNTVLYDKFPIEIDLFSKFLSYTNPDYKYNSTYLGQYVNDFLQVCQMLQKKDKMYHAIFSELLQTGESFELMIDRLFFAEYFSETKKCGSEYTSINISRILGEEVEIRVKYISNDNEHIFCKVYGDYKKAGIAQAIREDFERFVSMKEEKVQEL